MNSAVVCDVNETLLDLGGLDPLFEEWFGAAEARREWFARTLHLAMTLAATRTYRGFGEAGAAALHDVAGHRGISLPDDAAARLREGVIGLPSHPDVAPGLRRLREEGFTTAALSNNAPAVLREQMARSGLAPLFAHVISVEEAGALKPAPEVYRFAATRLGLPPGSIWMVAAHGWDVAGAIRAGLRGAFVARPGQYPDPLTPPEITGPDLLAVAESIVAAVSAA